MTAQPPQEIKELDLFELMRIFLKRKWLIIGITGTAFVVSVAFSAISLLLPPEKTYLANYYTPEALLMISNDNSSGGSLSSLLSSSSLSGLASLAGFSSTQSSNSSLAIFLLGTNSFLDSVVDHFDLINKYKITKSPRTTSREKLKAKFESDIDANSGVLRIKFTDTQPEFAQAVINYTVDYLERKFTEMGLDKNKQTKENLEVNIVNCYNEIKLLEKQSQELMNEVSQGSYSQNKSSVFLESKRLELEINAQQAIYIQLKTQYEVIKVTMASENPVFQVLEYAEIPDRKSGPSRLRLCLLVTFIALFFSLAIVSFLHVRETATKAEK